MGEPVLDHRLHKVHVERLLASLGLPTQREETCVHKLCKRRVRDFLLGALPEHKCRVASRALRSWFTRSSHFFCPSAMCRFSTIGSRRCSSLTAAASSVGLSPPSSSSLRASATSFS